MSEKCGKPAESLIAGASSFACVLNPAHEGPCKGGGNCFKHGEYIGIHGCPICFPPNRQPAAPVPQSGGEVRKHKLQNAEDMFCMNCGLLTGYWPSFQECSAYMFHRAAPPPDRGAGTREVPEKLRELLKRTAPFGPWTYYEMTEAQRTVPISGRMYVLACECVNWVSKLADYPLPQPKEAELRVESLRELSEKATKGEWHSMKASHNDKVWGDSPWIYVNAEQDDDFIVSGDRDPDLNQNWPNNAAFIVACVNFVRAALATRPAGPRDPDEVLDPQTYQYVKRSEHPELKPNILATDPAQGETK